MFTIEPYRNPEATTLLNLVGGADRARAAATQQAGAATAQGIQQIGQEAGASLNNLVKLTIDAPRREMEGIQLKQAKQTQADDQAARDAFRDSQGDPLKAVSILEQNGNYGVAMRLRSQINEQRLKGVEELGKQLDVTDKRLTTASQLLQGVSAAPDPATAYSAVLPQVRAIVGPDLGKNLPDDYDKGAVDQAMTWGMKASDVLRQRRDSARATTEALTTAVTKTELADKLTKNLATWAQTVDNQGDWDKMRETAKHIGGDVANDVLQNFPEQYSPQAVQQVAKLLGGDKFQHETVTYTGADGKTHIGEAGYDPKQNQWFAPGSTTPLTGVRKFERDPAGTGINPTELTQAVLANPDAFNDLTDTAKTAIWPALSKAGFQRPDPRDKGASVATAERWRLNQLAALDKQYRAAKALPEVNGAMSDDEYNQKKDEIEKSYLVQVGKPPTAAGGAKPGPATKPPAPAPTAPQASDAVPAAVSQLLATQPAGKKYTMTDGSVWIKDKDGKLRKGN